MDHDFGVVSKKSLPNPKSQSFSSMSSRSFIALGFTFRCVVLSGLGFVCRARYGLQLHLSCGCLAVPVPVVAEAISSPLSRLCTGPDSSWLCVCGSVLCIVGFYLLKLCLEFPPRVHGGHWPVAVSPAVRLSGFGMGVVLTL